MAHTKIDKFELLDHSASHLLHRAGQLASEIFAEEVGSNGLTPRQFAVLVTVGEREGLSQTELVEMTGIDRSTLADIVRRLLRKGLLVRRRTKEDQRVYSVRLSEQGHAAFVEYRPKAIMADDRILEAIPSELREPFLRAMRHMLGSVEEEILSPQPGSGSRRNENSEANRFANADRINSDQQNSDTDAEDMSATAA